MHLRKPIRSRSGPSKQQFLHNDLLQWAWKLPQLAAFITHQPQQTVFCFILFFPSLPFLSVPIREPPLSHLAAIHSLDWQVPSTQYWDIEAVGSWLEWCLHCIFVTFRPSQADFFFNAINDDWTSVVIVRLGQTLPLSEPLDKFCHYQNIWSRLMTHDICSLVLQWHSYLRYVLMLHCSKTLQMAYVGHSCTVWYQDKRMKTVRICTGF